MVLLALGGLPTFALLGFALIAATFGALAGAPGVIARELVETRHPYATMDDEVASSSLVASAARTIGTVLLVLYSLGVGNSFGLEVGVVVFVAGVLAAFVAHQRWGESHRIFERA